MSSSVASWKLLTTNDASGCQTVPRRAVDDSDLLRQLDWLVKLQADLAPAWLVQVRLQAGPLDQLQTFFLPQIECTRLIDGENFAVFHQYLAVYDHRVHVIADHLVDQAVDDHDV